MTQEYLNETLGCGPAPEGPVPEPETPRRPAPEPEGAAAPKKARRVKEKTRRVGTFTMGVSLIVAGISICAALALPAFNILLVAKLAPLVLVALGCEILWWSTHQGEVRIKYDFLSMLVCFCLLCGSVGAAMVPTLWRYYGPDRSMTERRLANELADTAYPALKGMGLRNLSVNISLSGIEFDPDMGLDQLTAQDYVSVNVSLRGPFEGADDFAESCHQVLGVLRGLNIKMRYVDFQASDELNRYYLDVYSIYDWDASAGQLAEQVQHDVYLIENDYWEEEQNYLLQSAYEEGWLLGCESAPEDEMPEYDASETRRRAFEMGWKYGREVAMNEYIEQGYAWRDPGVLDEQQNSMRTDEFAQPDDPAREEDGETPQDAPQDTPEEGAEVPETAPEENAG